MKQVLLLNRKNTDNLGDIAINLSMRKLIESTGNVCIDEDFSNPFVSGFISTTESTVSKKNKTIISILLRKLIHLLRTIPILYCYLWYFQNKRLFNVLTEQHIDAVVIGGGELIQSNLVFPIALYWWTRLIQSHGIGKCILFAVGVTKEWSPYEKLFIDKSLKHITDIYVRDIESQHNMHDLFGRTAHLIPDAVFINPIENNSKGNYSLYGITDYRRIKKHSKNFSDIEAYYDYSLKGICEIGSAPEKEVILFYTTKADLDACRELKSYCRKKHNMDLKIAQVSTLDDLKAYISEAVVVASPRMHACILGKLYAADVRPILISKKMMSFSELYKEFDEETLSSYQSTLISAMETALNN